MLLTYLTKLIDKLWENECGETSRKKIIFQTLWKFSFGIKEELQNK